MHSVFFYTNFLNTTNNCNTVASAHTFKRNFHIYKNSRATMICILQTVCPTVIFNFPFSTFNFKKLPLGHNMLFDIYKLSARIGNGGSPCGRPMNAPTDCFGFTTKTNGGH